MALRLKNIILGLFLVMLNLSILGNTPQNINKYDSDGKKTGYWIIIGSMIKNEGYPLDAIVEEGTFVKSRKTGLWKKYWENGQLKSEINFKRGRPNGKYVTYYNNGNIEEKSTWKGNKHTGLYEMYYPSGQLMKKKNITTKDDNLTEKTIYYHENGQKQLEFTTLNGIEIGISTWYYPSGEVKAKKEYSNGNIVSESFFEQEKKSSTETSKKKAKAPKAQGKENLAQGGKTGVSIIDGYHITYDDNKNILMEGKFKKGILYNGKHYLYDEYGLLDHIDVYKNGVFQGNGVVEDY